MPLYLALSLLSILRSFYTFMSPRAKVAASFPASIAALSLGSILLRLAVASGSIGRAIRIVNILTKRLARVRTGCAATEIAPYCRVSGNVGTSGRTA